MLNGTINAVLAELETLTLTFRRKKLYESLVHEFGCIPSLSFAFHDFSISEIREILNPTVAPTLTPTPFLTLTLTVTSQALAAIDEFYVPPTKAAPLRPRIGRGGGRFSKGPKGDVAAGLSHDAPESLEPSTALTVSILSIFTSISHLFFPF